MLMRQIYNNYLICVYYIIFVPVVFFKYLCDRSIYVMFLIFILFCGHVQAYDEVLT